MIFVTNVGFRLLYFLGIGPLNYRGYAGALMAYDQQDDALRGRNGDDWDEWPEDLRIQETPPVRILL